MKKIDIKIIHIITFLFILFIFPILMIITKDKTIDKNERRYLKQYNEINKEKFSKDFEIYLADQFPFRNKLREIKGFSNYNIFMKKENNDIIIKNGIAIKIDLNYNYDNVEKTIEKLNKIRRNELIFNKCYFAVIPDKNCYIENLNCDYEKIFNIVNNNMRNTKCINVFDNINLEDFYKTDSHWKQNHIKEVANKILYNMGNEIKEIKYKENVIDNFNGVYIGHAAIPLKNDEIIYLTNNTINNSEVFNYEKDKTTKIYDLEILNNGKSMDKYDIFLSGASPLLKITNNYSDNEKTLIMFRDSYGSSIAPLFVDYYKNIYVIDLRYIDFKYIENYITFDKNADVLFLYSTTLLETPNNFKIM